jgi:hypothetical protein
MRIEEKIIEYIHELPEDEKAEVLDFIDYLKTKVERKGMKEWTEFSLSSAMRGMEGEETLYSIKDLKESFS